MISRIVGFVTTLGVLIRSSLTPNYLRRDTPKRPNLPLFVDPREDMGPQGAPAESWFVFSNLRAGGREFGVVVHFLKTPFDASPTVAIADVGGGRFFLDEDQKGKLTRTPDGFQVVGDNLRWTANENSMQIEGRLAGGEVFNLKTRREGPTLAYNGTGYFPLIDNAVPTWQYAYPKMETAGTLTIDGVVHEVSGNSWFDRQWFRSLSRDFASGRAHWTWIATILPNGDVLAVWNVINKRERTWANILKPDGTLIVADAEPLRQNLSALWTSARSGVTWPGQWRIIIPGTRTELTVVSTADGQETFKHNPRLEAVVHITGTHEGNAVTSVGYAEIVKDPRLRATP